MNESTPFLVLLAKPGLRDPMALAKAMATARKTPMQDQMMAAKNGWGILAEKLSEAGARKLVSDFRGSGIESIVLPESSLAVLPEVQPAAAWDAVASGQPSIISAAGITLTSTTTKTIKEGPSTAQKVVSTAILLGTGLPIKLGGKTRFVEKTEHHSDLVFYLDLLYQNPPRRLRVNAQKFDYSFLKERKQYQILGNFKLLVSDLVKAHPQAWLNHGTRVLMESKPMQTMGYGSLTDLERETRWLLTIKA